MISNRFLSLGLTCRLLKIQQFSTTVQNYSKKKRDLIKKPKASLSKKFTDSMKSWSRLLGEEVEASFERLHDMIKSNVSWDIIEGRGLCMGNLKQVSYWQDPINGNIVTLVKDGLERRKFLTAGSPVTICEVDEKNVLKPLGEGYVSEVNSGSVDVKVMGDKLEQTVGSTGLLLMPSSKFGALQNLKRLLNDAELLSNESVHLANLAYRAVPMQSHHDRKIRSLPETLNESQVAAVSAAMNQKRNLLCIQGPPGTGKTRVIAECVFQLTQNKKKVLVCAPTHVAVKNAYNAAIDRMMDVYSEAEIEQYLNSLSERNDEEFKSHPKFDELVNIISELKMIGKDDPRYRIKSTGVYKLKMEIIRDIYRSRRAIFSTLATSTVQKLPSFGWKADVIIVDEAAQCTEPSTWIPVLTTPTCKKLILVGDQKQLPAVVLSENARKYGLDVSLMQRLEKEFHNCNINILLNEQHRMNKKIMHWSNEVFYESQLSAHKCVENITLNDLYPNLPRDHILNSPILMIDMKKKVDRTRESRNNQSYANEDELEVVIEYVTKLISEVGVEPSDIAIITPYNAQNEKLRERLPVPGIGLNTVDGFQGQEREIVIFCMVRDNMEGEIGFLKETRRLNVAVTRAKRHFLLIGSSTTMKKNKNLNKLYRYLESENAVHGVELLKKFDNIGSPQNQKTSNIV